MNYLTVEKKIRYFLQLDRNYSEKDLKLLAKALNKTEIDKIDQDLLSHFIDSYVKLDGSIFIPQIHKQLLLTNKKRAKFYFESYGKEKKTLSEETKLNGKKRKSRNNEKRLRKQALQRANDYMKNKKLEKIATQDKIKTFYKNVQKFK